MHGCWYIECLEMKLILGFCWGKDNLDVWIILDGIVFLYLKKEYLSILAPQPI
jgi:hypothetical protein